MKKFNHKPDTEYNKVTITLSLLYPRIEQMIVAIIANVVKTMLAQINLKVL